MELTGRLGGSWADRLAELDGTGFTGGSYNSSNGTAPPIR